MYISIASQGILFFLTVAMGVLCGFVFDFFRILRKSFGHKNIHIYIEDVLYWIIVILIFFYFLLHNAEGQSLRFFFIIGMFIGMVLYFLTMSKWVIKVSMIIIGIIKKLCKFIKKTIIKIVEPPKKLIINTYKFIIKLLKNTIIKPIKELLQTIKNYATIKTKKPIKKLKRRIKKVKKAIKVK